MPKYHLGISFRSNERPFRTTHDPYPLDVYKTDEEAIEWARGMAEGLYEYDVTLFKDGEPLEYREDVQ